MSLYFSRITVSNTDAMLRPIVSPMIFNCFRASGVSVKDVFFLLFIVVYLRYNLNTANVMEGTRFGKLVVLSTYRKAHRNGQLYATCQCDCGKTRDIAFYSLKKENGTRSCGCIQKKAFKPTKVKVGDRYGKLLVVRVFRKDNMFQAECVCDCGEKKEIITHRLTGKTKSTKSCGCLSTKALADNSTRRIKHGLTNTKMYGVWAAMIRRCENPNDRSYKNYGGRGIAVCERWKDFSLFLQDMGDRPEGLTLERNDVNKGYGPDNCRWATIAEQCRNRRNNVYVTIRGERLTVGDSCNKYNINRQTFACRLKSGWDVEKAMFEPVSISHRERLKIR